MVKAECEHSEIERRASIVSRGARCAQYTKWGDTQLRQHLKRLEETGISRVAARRHQGQLVVYQLPTSEEEANHSSNFAGSECATSRGEMTTSRVGCGHFAAPKKMAHRQHSKWFRLQLRGFAEMHIGGPRPQASRSTQS